MDLIRGVKRARLGRRLLAFNLTLLVCGAWSVVSGLAAPTNKVPEIIDQSIFQKATNGPQVAAGTLKDKNGRAASGTVVALAWPTEEVNKTFKVGDQIPTPTVGWARVGADGTYSLKIDPGRLSKKYMSAAGQVDLVVIAFGGGTQGQSGISVQLDPGQPANVASGFTKAEVPLQLTDQVTGGSTGGLSLGTTAKAVAGCFYVLNSTWNSWDNAGESYPYYTDTTSAFSITHTHGMTLGGAVSTSGAYGSWSSSGSYTVSAGVELTWDASPADRIYQIQTQYGKYYAICLPWMIKPIKPTGGAQTLYNWQTFCTYVVREPANFTFKRIDSTGHHFVDSGGVKTAPWIGINLSMDTNYGTDRWVSYHFSRPSRMCGNNDYPSKAGRISEIYYA